MKKKGFTLIEIIAALVILAIIVAIVTPIIFKIVDKADNKSNQISVENYGHAIEFALAQYELENGDYPTTIDNLNVKYSGAKVQCNVVKMRRNGKIFLSECYVDGDKVTDKKSYDNYYHYGKSDRSYLDDYGKKVENSIAKYISNYDEIPSSISELNVNFSEKINCEEVKIFSDGKLYLSNCKMNNDIIMDLSSIDRYYHYGSLSVEDLIKKANDIKITDYSSGNIKEMYTFNHNETSQTAALIDYRYIAGDPNNYVMFNGELWRIIGVFIVEDENGNVGQNIKIIRNQNLSENMKWNDTNHNNWNNSSLKEYLNTDYYDSFDEGAKQLIISAKYYLGAIESSRDYNYGNYILYDGSQSYIYERNADLNDVNSYWIGKIGLIYPSDFKYTFALKYSDKCYNDSAYWCIRYSSLNSWLSGSYYTITPRLDSDSSVYYVNSKIVSEISVSNSYSLRPVLYLNKYVRIKSGDGTIDAPYEFEM